MNNKVIGYSALVLGMLLLIVFANQKPTEINTHTESQVAALHANANQITWNNIKLRDDTIYNENGSCQAQHNGMSVYLPVCDAKTMSGINIKQQALFVTNRTNGTTYLFVYQGQLENARLALWRNYSHSWIEKVTEQFTVNNYLVTDVINYTDMGSPDSNCEFGNMNNTRKYYVTRSLGGVPTSAVYCFTGITPVNSTAFRISGNATRTVDRSFSGFRYDFDDISNIVSDVSNSMPEQLRKNFTFYKIEDVSPGSYLVEWTYTPENQKKIGKFHILAYPSDKGIIQAYNDGDYMYQDPSWNSTYHLGLTGYFPMDEGTGTRIGNIKTGDNGTLLNGATWTTSGIIGNATSYDGSDDYATTNTTGGGLIIRGIKPYTVNAWAYLDTSTDEFIFSDGDYPQGGAANRIIGTVSFGTWYHYGYDTGDFNTAVAAATARWYMVTEVFNGTSVLIYVNGTLGASAVRNVNLANFTQMLLGARYLNAGTLGGYMDGRIDEVGVWNRSLSAAEISDLYNGGAALAYQPEAGGAPTLTANQDTPNNLNTTDNTPDLKCNFTSANQNISSVKIDVLDSSNNVDYSNTDSLGAGVASYNKTWTASALTDDVYSWACFGFGNMGINASTSNRTIRIDTTNPTINITSPLNNAEIQTTNSTYNVTFNITSSDVNIDKCWYFNESANVTYTCGTNVSIVLGAGLHTIPFYVNDTTGHSNESSVSFLINQFAYSTYFLNSTVESSTASYYLNITATNISSTSANFSFNGTIYAMTLDSNNGTRAAFSRTIATPTVSNNTIYPIWFNYSLNGILRGTQTYNQTINNIPDVLTNCTTPALFFRLLDEETDAPVSATFDYNFQYGVTNSTEKVTYGTASGTTLGICVNTTISPNYTVGYGEIAYSAGSYQPRRYYVFEGTILNNVTQNITIYSLAQSSATSFLVEAEDSTLTPYDGEYLGLLRWYPELNSYNLVEMAKTDETGRSIMRVKAEDVDYRVALWYVNGTLIKLNSPTRFACIAQPCTYSFTVFPTDQDYTSFTGIQQSLTFNTTSSKFVYIWNDPSGRTQTMNLTAYKQTGTSNLLLCNSTGTGAVGVINCDVTGYTGLIRALVYRSPSPALPVADDTQNLGTSIAATARDIGLFIAAILAVIGFFIGIFNPLIGIIIQIASLIPSYFLGAIPMSVIIGFSVMAVVVIHFVRRAMQG